MAGHPREKITEGLDGLRDPLAEYSQMGLRFDCLGRWHSQPGVAQALARFAALCQEAGLQNRSDNDARVLEPIDLANSSKTSIEGRLGAALSAQNANLMAQAFRLDRQIVSGVV
jgi:fructose-bisphosphate aldolase class 1